MKLFFSKGKRRGINAKKHIKYKPIGFYISKVEIPPFGRKKYHKGLRLINFRWKDNIYSILVNWRT